MFFFNNVFSYRLSQFGEICKYLSVLCSLLVCLAESFSAKGKYLKRIRYHGRGMFGIMDKVNCHYFVKLVEGDPPTTETKTGFDQAKEYVQELKNRTITSSL